MSKNSKVDSADYILAGLQVDLLQKIRNGVRTSEDLKWFLGLSQNDLANYRGIELQKPLLPTVTPHLRLISGNQNLTIGTCKGGPRASLAYADKTFTGYVDGDFKNWKLDNKQPATEETPVLVYEMHDQDGNFQTIYNSLGVDKKALAFKSQEQVEKFVSEHCLWLRTDGYGTFFLFTEVVDNKEEFFVARVGFDVDGRLKVHVCRLSDDYVCPAGYRLRFVLPATRNLEA